MNNYLSTFKLKEFMLLMLFGFMATSCIYPKLDKKAGFSSTAISTANNTFARSSYQNVTITDSLKYEWDDNMSGQPAYAILQYSDHLIFTTRNGYLYFIETANPKNYGKRKMTDATDTAPTLRNSILYIAANLGDKGLIIYDMIGGSVLWELDKMLSQSSPVLFENSVIHATIKGDIVSIDLSTYENKWKAELKDKILNSLALSENNLIVATQNGIIRNYNPQNGIINWSLKINSAVYASPVTDGMSLFIACYNGDILKIDLLSGDIISKMNLDVPLYLPVGMDNEYLYLPLSNGSLVKLDKNSLKQIWQTELAAPFSASPLITENRIIAGTASKALYIIDKSSGAISQEIELEGRLRTQPLFYNNKIYLAHEKDILTIFSMEAEDNE